MTSTENVVGWPDVDAAIVRLAASGQRFDTALSSANRIAAYEPGYRLQLETPAGLTWIDIEHVQACWRTFEQLGRIRRRDVLDPGRCSAFMMALFALVPGVREEVGPETYLVLPA